MPTPIRDDLDDFPLSPSGESSAQTYFEAYEQGEELMRALPKNLRRNQGDELLYGIVKELLAARSGGETLFRRRADADEALTRFWLSKVRSTADWLVNINAIPRFTELDRAELSEIAKWSAEVARLPEIADRLSGKGIVLIYEPSIAGMKLDGSVFRIDSGNPVIALSLRYPRLDYFWFTLLHELSHVVLHFVDLGVPITDDLDTERAELRERQADRLARDSLIPRDQWRSCPAKYNQTEEEVVAFANKIGVHPSIVAGRLRRELNRHDIFSDLINSVNARVILTGHE